MTETQTLTAAELQSLFAVLQHPDHQRGLEDRHIVVEGLERRAEALVRVVARVSGSDDLSSWLIPNATVRLELPGTPEEFSGIEGAPAITSRVYTVAGLDPASRTIRIDFVRHPEPSPAMRWLDQVQPGDTVSMIGPRPHRVPGDGTTRILLADSSALPAALSILQRMPFAGTSTVIAAVPADEFSLFTDEARVTVPGADRIDFTRVDPAAPSPLASHFAGMAVPTDASVWAAGEREDLRAVRARCRKELGLPGERVQVFGYWKRGLSNTRMDLARLQATRSALAEGRSFGDTDDFEIGV